ncbi:sugar ABC transporter ATP-binding protein [Spirillospora sp. CA-294931]|uniref:sugar ABC transporter ATP-binding protein n=1 Tax=Spirillospora sp. CA-294931 TaxID=3240042 RepID=UPI003D8E339E
MLEADGVSKRFPGVLALDEVAFTLLPGEVHALVGENGAGKSTLIKVFTGAHRPDGGRVLLDGRPAAFGSPLEARRAGVSAIYQEVGLVPEMSVARNLLLGREPRTRLGVIDLARLNAAAERELAGLGVRADVRRPLRSLGLGTQQMVALARAVAVDARAVIMDEPTSSLEPREVETLFGVVRALRDRGISTIYVSHRLDELYRLCDRVTVLRDGRVAHTGPLADLDRLRLISLMLGRDLAEVRSDGVTRFSGESAASGPPVVEARGLTRRHVLSGVSVTVRPGEVVGLGGLLGAGRTETAKAIVGALPLDGGEVVVAGSPLRRRRTTAAAIRAGVSLLPEDRKAEGIVPALSVRENIALAALPRMARAGVVSDARIDRLVDGFMRRLRIKASSPHQRVDELSGGNQQKVLLARWLAMNPRALLLDEPTRGIDVGAKAEVQALIDELAREEGLGVLLISADLEELVEGSDRVVVLRDGAVAGELQGAELTEDRVMAAIAGDDRTGEETHG